MYSLKSGSLLIVLQAKITTNGADSLASRGKHPLEYPIKVHNPILNSKDK